MSTVRGDEYSSGVCVNTRGLRGAVGEIATELEPVENIFLKSENLGSTIRFSGRAEEAGATS